MCLKTFLIIDFLIWLHLSSSYHAKPDESVVASVESGLGSMSTSDGSGAASQKSLTASDGAVVGVTGEADDSAVDRSSLVTLDLSTKNGFLSVLAGAPTSPTSISSESGMFPVKK